MADYRERSTHVSSSIDVSGHGFDIDLITVAAADLCEEYGFTEAAELLRAAEGHDYTEEPQREHGWTCNSRSNQHFFTSLAGVRPVAICGSRIEWPHNWMQWHHGGRVCSRCAAELERRQAEFPEAWEAHLISMDESRPLLVAPEMTDERTGKEPTDGTQDK